MTDEPVRGVRALDKAMLGVCTRVSHHVQRRTGLTNFFIAKCLGVVAAGVAVLDLIGDFSPLASEDFGGDPSVLNDAFSLVFLGYMLIIRPERWEQEFLANTALPRQYLIERQPCRWRPIVLSATIFFPLAFYFMGKPVWIIVRSTGPLWVLLSLYFMAVTPLPPGQERVREKAFRTSAAMEPSH